MPRPDDSGDTGGSRFRGDGDGCRSGRGLLRPVRRLLACDARMRGAPGAGGAPACEATAGSIFNDESFAAIEAAAQRRPGRLRPLLVAHRLLAFLRLPIDSQCYVLRRAHEPLFSANPRAQREVALARGMGQLGNLTSSLWDLVDEGHPVLYYAALAHRRVQTHMLPRLYSDCDGLDGDAERGYLALVARKLREGLPVPAPATAQFLRRRAGLAVSAGGPGGGPASETCVYGVVTAYFAEAEALAAGHRWTAPGKLPAATAETARALLERGMELLRRAHAERPWADFLMTRWPLWGVLARLGAPRPPPPTWGQAPVLHLWHCSAGASPVVEELREAARRHVWQLRLAAEPDVRRCPQRIAAWASALGVQQGPGRPVFVAVLSPLLRRWRERHSEQLAGLLPALAAQPEIEIAGFPTVGSEGLWRWPMRRLRRRLRAVRYMAYPTGYAFAADSAPCFLGEATSGSKVFRLATLQRLLQGGAVGVASPAAWLVEMDLRAQASGVPAWTCLGYAVEEPDYLERARLTKGLARDHGLEAAEFGPEPGRRFVRCEEGAATLPLLPSPCGHRRLAEAFRSAVDRGVHGCGTRCCLAGGPRALAELWRAGWEGRRFDTHVTSEPCDEDCGAREAWTAIPPPFGELEVSSETAETDSITRPACAQRSRCGMVYPWRQPGKARSFWSVPD